MSPAKQIERMLKNARPLADWMKANKPDCKVLRVTASDIAAIRALPDFAKSMGMEVSKTSITWQGFELKPATELKTEARVP
jgi:hypothetical protein